MTDNARPRDPRDLSPYIWVKHDNGAVSRLLKPETYLERQSERSRTMPAQNYVAFVFEPSVQARADRHACYGLLNVVGCFNTEEDATDFVKARLQRDEDREREDEYLVAPCGRWCPLSTAPAALKGVEVVDVAQQLHGEYGSAVDNRKKHEMIDTTRRAQKAREEAETLNKMTQEERDRRAEGGADLESYTRLRAARASQLCAAAKMERMCKQALERIKGYRARAEELEGKMRAMPGGDAFARDFVARYVEELAKVGAQVDEDNPECDANYLALADEAPIRIAEAVRERVRGLNLKQAHEVDDD